MTIAIDFDNTIVETDESTLRKPIIIGFRKNAKEVINMLHDDGHYIIVNTCRCAGNLQAARDFLDENGVHYDMLNSNNPYFIGLMKGDCRKIFADIYIDDKNIGGIPSWSEIYDIISSKSN